MFLYFERNFSFFYWTCLACLSKTFQMNVLRQIIFLNKKFARSFLETTRKIVVLWQWKFYRLTKMRFICLEELFGRISFSEKNISSWITFSRIRREIFSRDLGKKQALGRNGQHGCQNRILRFQNVLSKTTLLFWMNEFPEIFSDSMANFFRTPAKNFKFLLNCFFYPSRPFSSCETFFVEN